MEQTRYLNDLIRCVRCGSCKAQCPIYDETASESMSARGRIALLHSLANGNLRVSPELHDRIFNCILCGACTKSCPPGVDIKEIIFHGRTLLQPTDKKKKFLRIAADFSIRRPLLMHSILRLTQHIFLPYLSKRELIPSEFELPNRCLGDIGKVFSVPRKKGRVALFTGCMVNFAYPHLGLSLINVLHTLGYEVILPAAESCCGAPLRSLGLEEEAKKLARKNVRLFSRLHVDAVLSLCPTCILTIKHEYPNLIGEGILDAQDISSFFLDRLEPSLFKTSDGEREKILYHNPCHLKYGLSIDKEPRELIRRMGFDQVRPREERCCGFGGVFSFMFRQLSQGLLTSWIRDYSESGAERIVTSCPGCMLQISKGLPDTAVVHLIEVLEEALVENPVHTPSNVYS